MRSMYPRKMESEILATQMTEDGSPTIYNSLVGEHYHSIHGAVQESRHVFIRAGLAYRLEQLFENNPIRIFEIGLGTGLNALLTLAEAESRPIDVEYFSIEKYPISNDLVGRLSYEDVVVPSLSAGESLELIHKTPWNEGVQLTTHFCLHKIEGDVCAYAYPTDIDVIYMDAFSPDTQPELWTADVFAALYHCLRPGGVLTTYCAKGAVRRGLASVGFCVERIPCPPGKREMLRASKGY